MTELLIAPCESKAARYACRQWHYSRSFPASASAPFGVWERGKFIGAVVFSHGPNRYAGRSYGLDAAQVCELTRVALTTHETPVTQIIAESIRLLRVHCPGLRLIVSFADPHQGHHGGIYQAGNWVYEGDTAPSKVWRDKWGRDKHPRVVSASGVLVQYGKVMRSSPRSEHTAIDRPGKHRYLYALDKPMRRQIAKLARPYPPRRGGLEGEPSAFRAGEAGSIPAPGSTEEALHGTASA
jgi:hypothetical protein